MWAGLSDHIIELVLIKLQDDGGLKAAAVIRLVCKAWTASFSEFTKEAELIVKQGSDNPLDRLCKMMPRLSGVLIRSTSDQLDLSPLGACAHLTRFCYYGEKEDHRSLDDDSTLLDRDLSVLPSSLREIVVSGINLNPDTLSSVKFVGLTKLTCFNTSKLGHVLWTLLGCLPALEELHMKICWTDHSYMDEQYREQLIQTWWRMSSLTTLKITGDGVALIDATLASCLQNLQELKFEGVGFSRAWIDAFSHPAMKFTLLDLHRCLTLEPVESTQVPAAVALRTLHAMRSDESLFHLASPGLQSLSTSGVRGAETLKLPEGLTALTRLELHAYNFGDDTLCTCVQSSNVRELILIKCWDVQRLLSRADSLTALRKVHIEQELWGRRDLPDASAIAQGIVSRPHLHQVSGYHRFFPPIEIRQIFSGWHQSAFTRQTIECHNDYPHNLLRVYTRP